MFKKFFKVERGVQKVGGFYFQLVRSYGGFRLSQVVGVVVIFQYSFFFQVDLNDLSQFFFGVGQVGQDIFQGLGNRRVVGERVFFFFRYYRSGFRFFGVVILALGWVMLQMGIRGIRRKFVIFIFLTVLRVFGEIRLSVFCGESSKFGIRSSY